MLFAGVLFAGVLLAAALYAVNIMLSPSPEART